MTLLKLLATALVALSFMVIALPGYAANDGDGVTGSAPNGTQDPAAARPRRHHRQQQNPDQGPINGGSGQG